VLHPKVLYIELTFKEQDLVAETGLATTTVIIIITTTIIIIIIIAIIIIHLTRTITSFLAIRNQLPACDYDPDCPLGCDAI
jgi:threonine/homoserine/homoserine lactone efflux protein